MAARGQGFFPETRSAGDRIKAVIVLVIVHEKTCSFFLKDKGERMKGKT